MYVGDAEEALNLYTSVFPSATVTERQRWAAGEPGPVGSFKLAHLRLAGQDLVLFDSPVKHDFSFTPSVSLFVTCDSERELDEAFARLADGGRVLMPLGNHGFSRKFGWLADRFGVSWQLDLP
jgi:predicted 3-demethylubiquinone-9 3-methyltransferase (glyoxalase superfamily)